MPLPGKLARRVGVLCLYSLVPIFFLLTVAALLCPALLGWGFFASQSNLLAGTKQDAVNMNRERTIQAQLRHPNIVSLQNFFQDRKFIYLALDFVAGGDLFKVSKKCFAPRRLIAFVLRSSPPPPSFWTCEVYHCIVFL